MLAHMVTLAFSGNMFEPPLGTRHDEDDFTFSDEDLVALENGEEPRFLFTSTSTVTVNSTLIRAVGAIIGALLLALPLYLAYATAAGGGGGGGGTGYHSGKRRRRRREGEDDDIYSSYMHFLLESFRKYGLEDDFGCQILIACEAGREKGTKKHSLYGKLPSVVHKTLR